MGQRTSRCDIYITHDKIKEEYGWKYITTKRKQKIIEYLREEVETYDDFLTGNIYFYNIEELNDNCGGFFGTDFENNGLMEYAKNSIDCYLEEEEKKEKALRQFHYNKIKAWIKNNVALIYRTQLISL